MWFDVNKKTPNFNVLVLAWQENFGVRLIYYSFKMVWLDINDDVVEGITHWKPLPDKPTKENTYE